MLWFQCEIAITRRLAGLVSSRRPCLGEVEERLEDEPSGSGSLGVGVRITGYSLAPVPPSSLYPDCCCEGNEPNHTPSTSLPLHHDGLVPPKSKVKTGPPSLDLLLLDIFLQEGEVSRRRKRRSTFQKMLRETRRC